MKGMLFTLPGRQVLVETSCLSAHDKFLTNPVRPGIGWLYACYRSSEAIWVYETGGLFLFEK